MNLLLLVLFCLGVAISYSSNSYFGIWVGLEVSTISIYPLLISDNSEPSCVTLIKILVLQAVSSALLLLGLCVFLSEGKSFVLGIVVVICSIFLKVGGFSVGWLVFALEGLDWLGLFVILGAHNLPVLAILLSVSNVFPVWWTLLAGISLGCISLIGCTVLTFRSFMVISSVLNIGWVWCSCAVSSVVGCTYFGFYVLSFVVVVVILSQSFLKEYGTTFSYSMTTGFEVISVWLISGLPPFVLFFCNADLIWVLAESQFSVECFVLIITSVCLVYIYTHIIYVALVNNMPYRVNSGFSGGLLNLASLIFLFCAVFSFTFFLI